MIARTARGATAPRLLLEVVCARLLLPSASDTESALLQRVERIETRLDMSIPAGEAAVGAAPRAPKQFVRKTQQQVSEPPRSEPPVPAPPAPEPPPSEPPVVHAPPAAAVPPPAPPAPEPTAAPSTPGAPDAAAVRSMWTTVREKVRQRSRTTEVMLSGATVRAVEDNTLVLMHESAPLAKRLAEQRNSDVIREALKDALGVDWRVRCEVGSAAPAVPAQAKRETLLKICAMPLAQGALMPPGLSPDTPPATGLPLLFAHQSRRLLGRSPQPTEIAALTGLAASACPSGRCDYAPLASQLCMALFASATSTFY